MKLHITENGDFSSGAMDALLRGGFTLTDNPQEAEVLWVRLGRFVGIPLMGPTVRCIVSPTTGLNHIDLDACERRGVTVLCLKGETDFLREIRATAEHTILLMLALLRNLPPTVDSVKRGEWDRERFKGRELARAKVGIIGYPGRVAQQLLDLLVGFQAEEVLFAKEDWPPRADTDVGRRTAGWIGDCDIVTLHANYTPENEQMCDAAFFAAMKRGALFINTSRGELVCEAALWDALRKGHLGGAAIDVLANEQMGRRGFMAGKSILEQYAREHDNLIITPHIGGCTYESMAKTEEFMAGKLLEWAGKHAEELKGSWIDCVCGTGTIFDCKCRDIGP